MAIILTPEQFKKRYGQQGIDMFKPVVPQTRGQETISDIKQTGSALKRTFMETGEKLGDIIQAKESGKQGKFRSALQATGAIAGGISRSIGDLFTGAIKTFLSKEGEEKVKEKLGTTVEKALPFAMEVDEKLGSPVAGLIDRYNNLDPKAKRDIDSVLGVSNFIFDVATLGGAKKVGEIGVKKGVELAGEGARVGKEVLETGVDLTKKATSKIIKSTKTPEPKPIEAIGQILQGKTKDIKSGVKALSELDTTGVKTYQELENKVSSRISELSKVVDDDLASDPTKRMLNDLVLETTTKGGKKITSNPVENALKQLDELYEKTGDLTNSANIKELMEEATQRGLTNQEINDLARVYGQEFGQKAFSKLGDPLTSVNAQMYENTRKSLKELARQGIKGSDAKVADEAMSNLYRMRDLVKKNVEAVNKIQQKIQERGLVEKIGHKVAKYGNVLTGGGIRGFIGGLLPRGAGYKVMNALDIEEVLSRNLKIIQDAIKSGNDEEIIKILGKLK